MANQETQKKYWFRTKTYGYGWAPATKEGWIVVILYVLSTVGASIIISQFYGYGLHSLLIFLSAMAFLTSILLVVSIRTGEKPQWRWGNKKASIKK